MRLVWVHVSAELRAIMRDWRYVVFSLLFPVALFLFFGAPYASEGPEYMPAFLMTSFTAYAIIGVVLFQFGIRVAMDRRDPWYRFLRVLPVRIWTLSVARIAAGMVFALLAGAGVVLEAFLLTDVDLPPRAWPRLALGLMVGSIPFGALGLAIGNWASPRASVPIANLIYLVMSYAGGLWIPPDFLPAAVKPISAYLPTYLYGQLLWPAVLDTGWSAGPWLWLLAYSAVFAGLALWGYRRDEGQRFLR